MLFSKVSMQSHSAVLQGSDSSSKASYKSSPEVLLEQIPFLILTQTAYPRLSERLTESYSTPPFSPDWNRAQWRHRLLEPMHSQLQRIEESTELLVLYQTGKFRERTTIVKVYIARPPCDSGD